MVSQPLAAVGSGGMGDVFEARRADGNHHGRAAAKLLERGMDSVGVLKRFASERARFDRRLVCFDLPPVKSLADRSSSRRSLARADAA